MHYSKHSNNSTANEIYSLTFSNNKSSTEAQSKVERNSDRLPTLSLLAKKKEKKAVPSQDAGSDTVKPCRLTAPACNTDSTDSGVNLSDNNDIPHSPHKSLQLYSFESNSTSNNCNKKFHKHNENINGDKNVSTNQSNSCTNVISNSNRGNVVNYDDENKTINSQNFDNKFEVTDSGNQSDSTGCQEKSLNFICSGDAVNCRQQRNREILAPTKTSKPKQIATLTDKYNDKLSFQHNEAIQLQERSSSTTPSLSMSSTTNSYDGNPPSNMHYCKGSPVVSIRSINSAIITSDSDSDSDPNSDAENYVIKKLGTQVTYSPNDLAIPIISNGHTLLNQKIVPNNNQATLPPLEALAVISDRIGTAQALGPAPPILGVPQRPQIGSIALSNSSDVTFGDKHFYEGPVTIQQFLIDSREKCKETNGQENPLFPTENVGSTTNNAKDRSPEAEKSSTIYEYILKRKRMIIPGLLAFTTLLIVVTIWGSKMLTESKNTSSGHNSDDFVSNRTLCLIDRDIWRAHPRTGTLDEQKLPLHRAVISHTASEPCASLQTCAGRVRVIQEFHMNSLGWDDIGYNFLISSDGRVYVGRGWDYVGAHTKGYNYDSVGITFIGTYISVEPTQAQLNACLSLLEEGVHLKKLTPDYRLYGARQLGATESPGEMLYKRIKKWTHWSANINTT